MGRAIRKPRLGGSRLRRPTPYPLPFYSRNFLGQKAERNLAKQAEKVDWEDALCSVCMEVPHNAVLLLCSSHDKGCRPYMCGTSFHHSNCLDQFKKAYTKIMSPSRNKGSYDVGSTDEVTELVCPLCRGEVKGWTVVESAREYLNAQKRSCMQDDCLYTGTFKQLQKHLIAVHPNAQPRKIDPLVEQKWKRLEHDRERADVISTIRASIPGAVVVGDFVIERGTNHGFYFDDEDEEDDLVGYSDIEDEMEGGYSILRTFENNGSSSSYNSWLQRLDRTRYHVGGGEENQRVVSGNTAFALNNRRRFVRGRSLGREEPRRQWGGRRT